MHIKEIRYNDEFAKQFKTLPKTIQKRALTKELIFRENPFHPSLRLHKLKGKLEGLWSISVNMQYRIIFKPLENSTVLFVSIGVHAIYE